MLFNVVFAGELNVLHRRVSSTARGYLCVSNYQPSNAHLGEPMRNDAIVKTLVENLEAHRVFKVLEDFHGDLPV